MIKTMYFLNGLPRSGSTLLSNILNQNPRFHSTETSGCMDIMFAIRNQWESFIQHKASPCTQKMINVIKASMNAYYDDIDKPIVFDKSRGWLPYIEFVENITQTKMKILVTVRPVVDILASLEMLYRETSKVRQPPGEAKNYYQFQTVQGRCDYWLRNDQVVGISLNRIQDAVRRGLRDRLHFIDFNYLTSHPENSLKKIYEFINEDYYNHDFDNVEQVTSENDDIYGFVNLHKIRNKVEPVKSRAEELLGKDVIEYIRKQVSEN